MGREDVAVCHWKGDIAEVRLHLDSKELTLRGDFRAAIARNDMRDVLLDHEGVRIVTDAGDLLMEFAAVEAKRWQTALLKTPPTLAEKLGVSEVAPAFVLGQVDDPVLKDALGAAVVKDASKASLLVAMIFNEVDLAAASDLATAHPNTHLWAIYRKGKAAVVGDTVIRTHLRGIGFIDSKSCAVSDQLTATRYRLR